MSQLPSANLRPSLARKPVMPTSPILSASAGADGSQAAKQAGRVIAISAALSSLIQGYNTGVIGGALLSIVPEFGLESQPWLQGLIVTATTVGSLLGTASASQLSDSVGRRGTLLFASSFFIAAALLMPASRAPRGSRDSGE